MAVTGPSGGGGSDGTLGVPEGTVHLTKYNPGWTEDFEAERDRLAQGLAKLDVVAIEHIGSTAVPNMTAKPLIDVMIGVRSVLEYAQYVQPMERLGYVYNGEYGLPNRHFFTLGDPTVYHVHLVQHNLHFWRLNLFFRDTLRKHESARERYVTVKRELAQKYADSRKDYTAGKDGVIREILAAYGWDDTVSGAVG